MWGSDVVSLYLIFASDQHGADETAAWLPRRERSSWHRLPAGAVGDDVEEDGGDDDDVEDDDAVAKDDVEDDGGDDETIMTIIRSNMLLMGLSGWLLWRWWRRNDDDYEWSNDICFFVSFPFADEQRRGCAGGGQRDSHVQVMISQIFPTTCLRRGIWLVGSSNLLPTMSATGSSGLVTISSTVPSDKINATSQVWSEKCASRRSVR